MWHNHYFIIFKVFFWKAWHAYHTWRECWNINYAYIDIVSEFHEKSAEIHAMRASSRERSYSRSASPTIAQARGKARRQNVRTFTAVCQSSPDRRRGVWRGSLTQSYTIIIIIVVAPVFSFVALNVPWFFDIAFRELSSRFEKIGTMFILVISRVTNALRKNRWQVEEKGRKERRAPRKTEIVILARENRYCE